MNKQINKRKNEYTNCGRQKPTNKDNEKDKHREGEDVCRSHNQLITNIHNFFNPVSQ